MTFINAIAGNLWGYDTLIIFAAMANSVLFMLTKWKLRQFGAAIYMQNDASLYGKNAEILVKVGIEDVKKIKNARHVVNQLYSVFTNVITIFPLLGLIGTVYALINITGAGGMDNMQDSFMISLTSTFWGMIFAIVYKIADATISPDVERYNNDADRTIAKQED
ncbi:MAG: MotA/TolQ/ExbB proton channel family protein [Defluviitaleaceae bacterium]|nr:MotA/TolQ/ExbB proton channel family protein [Defluviitaleaceae bacterium]MCL2273718.1 MotA/TolQ/ExbB proton channel family protein [Defluviitaleaceae bacterium]